MLFRSANRRGAEACRSCQSTLKRSNAADAPEAQTSSFPQMDPRGMPATGGALQLFSVRLQVSRSRLAKPRAAGQSLSVLDVHWRSGKGMGDDANPLLQRLERDVSRKLVERGRGEPTIPFHRRYRRYRRRRTPGSRRRACRHLLGNHCKCQRCKSLKAW